MIRIWDSIYPIWERRRHAAVTFGILIWSNFFDGEILKVTIEAIDDKQKEAQENDNRAPDQKYDNLKSKLLILRHKSILELEISIFYHFSRQCNITLIHGSSIKTINKTRRVMKNRSSIVCKIIHGHNQSLILAAVAQIRRISAKISTKLTVTGIAK